MPPWIVRRALITPLVLALEAALLALSPLTLLVSALFGSRGLRAWAIATAGVARHAATILALGWLWLTRAGEERHYALMRWFVGGVVRIALRAARVDVRVDETPDATRALQARERPLILLARHAGEGDTLLVIHELLDRHGYRPRVVAHERLRLDPVVDMLGGRLPNRFVDPRGGDTERDIAEMAADLQGNQALVIFPEGANFSEASRRRGIERLEQAGHQTQAEQARALRHLSAPRPGGALAAVAAAPHADVLMMGHAGFPTGFAEVWRELPRPQVIDVHVWHESADAVPDAREAQIEWLFEWWARMDAWVAQAEGARMGD